MKVGVVTFPGSLDDRDALAAVSGCGGQAHALWHADDTLGDVGAVILPGGFSYGDYLRTGAIAHRAPIMRAVATFAADGGPVLGICNGFQVLCEAGLLPGALLGNAGRRFVCRSTAVTVENTTTPWTRGFAAVAGPVSLPVKNGQGRYHADNATLDRLEAGGQVVFRYTMDNPTGSERDIAGICNEQGNVVGLMPHPEHAVDVVLWGRDGARPMFEGLLGAYCD